MRYYLDVCITFAPQTPLHIHFTSLLSHNLITRHKGKNTLLATAGGLNKTVSGVRAVSTERLACLHLLVVFLKRYLGSERLQHVAG